MISWPPFQKLPETLALKIIQVKASNVSYSIHCPLLYGPAVALERCYSILLLGSS